MTITWLLQWQNMHSYTNILCYYLSRGSRQLKRTYAPTVFENHLLIIYVYLHLLLNTINAISTRFNKLLSTKRLTNINITRYVLRSKTYTRKHSYVRRIVDLKYTKNETYLDRLTDIPTFLFDKQTFYKHFILIKCNSSIFIFTVSGLQLI